MYVFFQFDYATPTNNIPMNEAEQEPVDNGPKPWNEPKIPMAQVPKSAKEQFEEAKEQIKV